MKMAETIIILVKPITIIIIMIIIITIIITIIMIIMIIEKAYHRKVQNNKYRVLYAGGVSLWVCFKESPSTCPGQSSEWTGC